MGKNIYNADQNCDCFSQRLQSASIGLASSDESKLSWLEPYLELKGFQLSSAWLVTFFTSARNQKLAENEPKFDSQLKKFDIHIVGIVSSVSARFQLGFSSKIEVPQLNSARLGTFTARARSSQKIPA